MDYLDKNNIYKPETITLKFEDYQKLLDRIKYDEEFENKLQEMVKEKKLICLKHKYSKDMRAFVTLDRLVKRDNHWEIVE